MGKLLIELTVGGGGIGPVYMWDFNLCLLMSKRVRMTAEPSCGASFGYEESQGDHVKYRFSYRSSRGVENHYIYDKLKGRAEHC